MNRTAKLRSKSVMSKVEIKRKEDEENNFKMTHHTTRTSSMAKDYIDASKTQNRFFSNKK